MYNDILVNMWNVLLNLKIPIFPISNSVDFYNLKLKLKLRFIEMTLIIMTSSKSASDTLLATKKIFTIYFVNFYLHAIRMIFERIGKLYIPTKPLPTLTC